MLEFTRTKDRLNQTAEAPEAGNALVENVMKIVIDGLKEMGVRSECVVLVGGGPMDAQSAGAVGADIYCPDASVAVKAAGVLAKGRAFGQERLRRFRGG